jgi:hypothetical protein
MMNETAEQTQPELIGHALDAAVAALEGADVENPPAYSTDPSLGHPIIEREHITQFAPEFDGGHEWEAIHGARLDYDSQIHGIRAFGPTALIAAMRCYVLSKSQTET